MDEILLIVDAVSREKGVEKEIIFQAIEAALATATRKKHEGDIDARVTIDRNTGAYDTVRIWEVIEDDAELEFPDRQIFVSDARKVVPEAEVGGTVEDPLEPVEFGRIAAQAAKQVIMQKVREAERSRIVEEFADRKGEMVTGLVKRMERGDAIIEIGSTEAVLQRSAMIPRESLRPGDRIRAYLADVRPVPRGPQLFLSRVAPELLIELFKLEVPEAGEGLITIHSAARDPGVRAKIAVSTSDARIDPIGACVGMRGSRVQSVSNELAGERVDIILWAGDPAQFVISSLAPAEVESIVVDEDAKSMDVIVDESQLSLAIGRGGQNVRLASELTGWEINIMTAEVSEEKTMKESEELVQQFVKDLDVDEEIAGILVQEGFTNLEEVAYVPKQEIMEIEGFDEELVEELRNRARDVLLTKAIVMEEQLGMAEPTEDLLGMEGMDETLARMLANKGIKSMEDLAEQAVDELIELGIEGVDEEKATTLIMTARKPWFDEE
ncbi:MAG: transcription termination factor NusA [Gammaproteobacteria bacterium]|nr:transcription termination factor NusA [Gammaproteobacteria bacterium]